MRYRFLLIVGSLLALSGWAAADDYVLHTFERKQLTPIFYCEGASFGDFNRDGKMDVVSGPFWYAGPEFTEKHEYYPAKPYDKNGYSDNFFAFTDDLNHDGWTDILIVGFPGKEAFWYANPQGQSGHWQRHEAFDIVDNESPQYTDLTGDGRPELVFHTRGQFGYAGPDPEDATKPWKFHAVGPAGPYQRFTHGLGIGDVNGDGRMDILEAKGWLEQPPAGTEGFWQRHDANFGNGGAQMYVYDVDGDGDNDVITSLAAHQYGLAWFEQTREGDAINFTQHLIMGDKPEQNEYGLVFSQMHAVELVDMDGDGLKDIVTGKRHWAHNGNDPDERSAAVSYWFKLVRGERGVHFVPMKIDDNSGVGTQLVVGDLNGDKLYDLVVGNKLGTFVVLHHAKPVSREEWEAAQPKPVQPQAANDPAAGQLPTDEAGHTVDLDFESGTLDGWAVEGKAFDRQPVRGDTVAARRNDMRSEHHGDYWIGTFEVAGDAPRGTLTSPYFVVSQPWASFLVAGGAAPATRVELVREGRPDPIYSATGENTENLQPVVVDLRPYQGQKIAVRIADTSAGGWGHINFDNFRLHAERPKFANERTVMPVDQYPYAGLSPDAAAKAMTVPDGFTVTAFAGEPDVHQPIGFCFDDRGRLWVAEAYSYPAKLPADRAKDRVLIFADTDGDGHFDERKVFAEKLNLVSGIEYGHGGLWIGAAPELLFIPDRNHDDQPDGPAEVLLDGWGYQDSHETLNTFIWGPDGWLYGCHGVFTHSLVGKPGTPKDARVPINAGIWRYHPTRHEFEVFGHGTSNPWGVDFDDYGQTFCTACVIPHLYHIIEGARYQRQAGQHFNRATYADIQTIARHRHWIGANPHGGNNRSDAAGGGHAHSGAMIYLGGAWPAVYRNQIFMNNIHGNRINVDRLGPEGSGYFGDRAPDFLLTGDTWSQILNLRYGPDGQVYMIDWYDANACHRLEADMHDRTNGRIYKISYGKPEPSAVDLTQASDLELVAYQLHANDWFVRHARRLLAERGGQEEVWRALDKIAFEHADPTRRVRGIWALQASGGLTLDRIERALGDESPYVRGWAIQLAHDGHEMGPEFMPRLLGLAEKDPSPVVRLYLASAAQKVPLEERVALLRALLAHGEDAGDHNLPLMYWYALEPLAAANPAAALELASATTIPPLLEFTVRRIGETGTPEAIALLVDGLNQAGNAVQQLTLLGGIQKSLEGRRRVDMPANWPTTFARLYPAAPPELQSRLMALAVTFGDKSAFDALKKVLVDRSADAELRMNALTALVAAKTEGLAGVLQLLLDDAALRGAALRGLAGYDDPATPERILGIFAELTPAERRDALATMAARAASAKVLLAAVGSGRVRAADLSADVVRQLKNLRDAEVDRLIGEVWGTASETTADKAQLIAQYKDVLGMPHGEPDLALGRAVFARTCQQCHTLFGVGGKVGPELTGSNRANLDYILSNILDPSALIGKEYVAQVLALEDGRVVTGIVRNETPQALTVLTANETLVIPRDEISEMAASDKSMMPDDILKPLNETELRGLIGYLASPGQTPMLAMADNAKTLFNGRDLTGWNGNQEVWHVENGELVGKSAGLKRNEFLYTDLEVSDFRLKLEVQLVNNAGNSGVQFRSEPIEGGEMRGYQADIGVGWWGKLYEESGRGLLTKKSGESLIKPGEWTTYEIEAVGGHVRLWLNGQSIVDLDDPDGRRRGVLAVQVHSGGATEVRFRNFELTILNPDGKPAEIEAVSSAQGN
ncbi:MAG: DUF1080 domain-containing protein [Pirellulales bacterium]|nr:DUF1080 domain-containing protein [Pirellulales bacterium]